MIDARFTLCNTLFFGGPPEKDTIISYAMIERIDVLSGLEFSFFTPEM